MLSKAKVKFIKSLQIKKYRKQEQCFIVQGAKSVQELLHSGFEVITIVGTDDFLTSLKAPKSVELIAASGRELEGLGEFQSNDSVLAIARMRPNRQLQVDADEFALVLDDIRDPGNLGTIIRTADWFGISRIIASEETADFYNPKVISATMGSFVRTEVFYTDLPEYLSSYRSHAHTPRCIYGAFLNGRDVHQVDFRNGGLIVIGNESRGISPQVEKLITDRITIPRYGRAESLNAAIATAIICDNLRR
jgi:TrmH family RNA methyltransferase